MSLDFACNIKVYLWFIEVFLTVEEPVEEKSHRQT